MKPTTARSSTLRQLLAMLALSALTPLAFAVSADEASSVADITRINTQRIAAQQAAIVLASESADIDGDGFNEAPAMLAGSGVPVAGGRIPLSSAAPKDDSYGTKFGYCSWDNGSVTSGAGRIPGSNDVSKPVLAVIASGLDNVFQTSCADVYNGTAPKGDDYVVSMTTAQLRAGSGTMYFGDPVADNAARDALDHASLHDGEVRLVKSTSVLWRWNVGTNTWIQVGLTPPWLPGTGSAYYSNNPIAIGTNTASNQLTVVEPGAGIPIGTKTAGQYNGVQLYNPSAGTNGFVGYDNTANKLVLDAQNAGGQIGLNIGGTTYLNVANNGLVTTANGLTVNGAALTANNGIATTTLNTSGLATLNSLTTANATITGGSINGTPIGFVTPSTGAFTTVSTSGALTVGGALGVTGAITATGTVTATGFIGDGSALTGFTSGQITTALGYTPLSGSGNATSTGTIAITGGSPVGLANGAYYLRTGLENSTNLIQDTVAIQARNNGAISTLNLNPLGGSVTAPQVIVNAGSAAAPGLTFAGSTNTGIYAPAADEIAASTAGTRALWVKNTGAVALGAGALAVNPAALTSATAVGYQALAANTTGGIYNSALGYQALTANTTGYYNSATGYRALATNSTGFNNTANGYVALQANTTGTYNTAIGGVALVNNSTGGNNTATGYEALASNTTASDSTAFGRSALYKTTAGGNTAIGSYTAYNNTSGANNTAAGASALFNNSTGSNNAAYGNGALSQNTTGSNNAAYGYQAGSSTTNNLTGGNNTFLGTSATIADNAATAASGYLTLLGAGSSANLGASNASAYASAIGAGASVTSINTVVLGRTTDKIVIGATADDGTAYALQVTSGIKAKTGGVSIAGGDLVLGSANISGTIAARPAFGVANRIYVATDTNEIYRDTGAAWVRIAAGAPTIALSALTAATATNTLANSTYAQNWNWQLTGAGTAFAIGETAAASGGAGNQYLQTIGTLATSTAIPLSVSTRGVEAFRVDSVNPQILANLGSAALPTYSFSGDTNTGFYSPAADEAGLSVGGSRALWLNNTGVAALGSGALAVNPTGVVATAVGYQALAANTTGGVGNSAFGYRALYSNTTGTNNTASGYQALGNNTTGLQNTAAGVNALYTNSTGNNNVANGYRALYANSTGYENLASGANALSANTSGYDNTATGFQALYTNSTGYENVASGTNALYSNLGGYRNVGVGNGTLYLNTSGNYNAASGYEALNKNTTASGNAAFGYRAGYTVTNNVTGGNNTFLGYNATLTDNANTAASGLITLLGANSSANLGAANASAYATAVGAGSSVTSINTVVLGRAADKTVIGATADDGTAYALQVTGGIKALTGGVNIAGGDLVLGSANITGTLAARPGFGVANRVYVTTDTGEIFRDTGAAWVSITPAYTGDVTKAAGSTVTALSTTGVTAASYGTATAAPTFTVDAKGRLTAAGTVTITPAWTSITGTPTTLGGYGITDANPAYTGDVTKALNGTVLTLANVATAGTSTKVTYNAKGLVTSGTAAVLASADYANQGTTTTFLKGNAAGNPSWSAVSLSTDVTGTLAAAQFPALTGDVTTVAGALGTTLANTAVVAASYGTATAAPTFTVDAKGRLTAAGTVTITPAWASITGTPTTLGGYGITDANPAYTGDVTKALNGTVLTLANVATAGTSTKVTYNAKGLVTSGTPAVLASADYANQGTTTTFLKGNAAGNPSWSAVSLSTDVSGTLAAAQFPALTGDLTTAAGSLATTLANSGVTAASYGTATAAPTFTVDAKGRLTAAGTVTITPAWSSITGTPTTLGGYGITDANPAYTGDVTKALNGTVLTLANVATAGTNTKVTYNAKGLVTSGTAAVLASADYANQGTTTTFLKGNAAGNPSWSAVSLTTDVTGTLAAAQFPALTGDLTTAAGSLATTLANSGVTAASYGTATAAPTFTVDAKGRLTAAGTVTITPAWASITGTPTTVAGYGITDANPAYTGDVTKALNGTVLTLANVATAGTSTKVTYNAKGLVTSGTSAVLASADYANQGTTTTFLKGNAAGNPSWSAVSLSTDVTGTLAAAQFPALTGDLTTSAGSLATTLATTGVTAASYGSATASPTFTVDAKGRLTAAANVTITPALSSLTAATATNTIANTTFQQNWNWQLTSALSTGFSIGETAASSSGAGAQFLMKVGTLATSTAIPLSVSTRGVQAFRVDSVNPQIIANAGSVGSPTYAFNGDLTSGFYLPTNGQIAASVGGTRSLWLTGGATGLGYGALAVNPVAVSTATAVGYQALAANTTGGDYNSALGYGSLSSNTTGTGNTAVGYQALSGNTTAAFNTAVGKHALLSASTGGENTAVGYQSAWLTTTGTRNVAMGRDSMWANTTGSQNVGTGSLALYSNTSGTDNVASGYQSLYSNVSGNYSASIGSGALFSATGGSNSALGYRAGYSVTNALSTTNNTFVGYNATITDNANTAGSGYLTLLGAGSNANLGAANATAYATALGAGSSVTSINTVVLGRTSDKTVIGATADDGTAYNLQVTGGIKAKTGGISVAAGDLVLGSSNISGTFAGKPAFGVANRIYFATDTNEIYRDTGAAWVRVGFGTAGGTALSALTAATGANTLANTTYAQNWNWQLTGAGTGFAIGETAASTGGAGTQYLQTIGTLAASTAIPLSVSTRGTEAFRVDSTNPQIVTNVGTVGAPSYSFNSDQTTGFYRPAASQLAASVAGTRAMWLTGGAVGIGSGALAVNPVAVTTATAVGYQALAANTTGGDDNSAFGYQALAANTTGKNNTAIGSGALSNVSNNANTAIGYWALKNATSGPNNTATGYYSLYNVTSGNSNTANGYSAGYSFFNAITGGNNTFIGANATITDNATTAASGLITLLGAASSANLGASNITAYATAVGAGSSVTSINTVVLGRTSDKTVIGATADDGTAYNLQVTGGIKAKTGGISVAAGDLVLGSSNISGTFAGKPAFGVANRIYFATDTNEIYRDTGAAWVRVGFGTAGGTALSALTAATAANTIANTTYQQNWNWQLSAASSTGLAIGETAASTSGAGAQYLTTIGTLAASTAIPLSVSTRGVEAFRVDSTNPQLVGNNGTAAAPTFTFNSNRGTGFYMSAASELNASVSGSTAMRLSNGTLSLTAIGRGAGSSVAGANNTAIGYSALTNNTTGVDNTAIGYGALQLSSGSSNTAVGKAALLNTSSNNYNAAVGNNAQTTSTGNYNASVGYNTLYYVTSDNNSALGSNAGYTTTNSYSGANSTFVGANTLVTDNAIMAASGRITLLGADATASGLGSSSANAYMTALGSGANVTSINTVVLGRTTDKTVIGATATDGSAYSLQVTGGIKAVTGGINVAAGDLVLGSSNISGTFAAKPAFGTANRIYFSTDTGEILRDTGAAWVSFTPAFTGDVTKAVNGTVLTLANVATAGTNTKVTYNAKGLVTSGTSAVLASADYANQGTTTTFLKGNAAGNPSWSAVSLTTDVTGTLAAAQFPALTGDLTTSAGSLATTLANTGVTAASYGSATASPTFTVDAKGRLTAAANVTITPALSSLTAATGSNTLANGANSQNWNWKLTAASSTGFAIGETTASTGGAGAQYLTTIGTLAASTAIPLSVSTRGVEAFRVDSANPQIVANVGTVGAPSYSFNGSQTTGFYSPAANQIAASVAGTRAMWLTAGSVGLGSGALAVDSAGTNYNTAVGFNALLANTTGSVNTAVGYQAMLSNTTGTENVGVGRRALNANTASSYSTAVGSAALEKSTGGSNTAIGALAGYTGGNVYTGANSTFVGQSATVADTAFMAASGKITLIGDNSSASGLAAANATAYMTALGAGSSVTSINTLVLGRTTDKTVIGATADNGTAYNLQVTGGINAITGGVKVTAGQLLTADGTVAAPSSAFVSETNTGFYRPAASSLAASVAGTRSLWLSATNASLGAGALAATTGLYNTAAGASALLVNNSGYENTAVGRQALVANTTGFYNVAVGNNALATNTTADSLTAVGYNALASNTSGTLNTALGYAALASNSSGFGNIAVGNNTMQSVTTGSQNTALGAIALSQATASNNTAVGYRSMSNSTTGGDNVAVGVNTLLGNTSGYNNIAIGNNAMQVNTTGNNNAIVGFNSMNKNTTGYGTSTLGKEALYNNTTGSYNIAIGEHALYTNSTNSNNVAIGVHALELNTVDNNTAVGHYAMAVNSTATSGSAFGYQALYNTTTGANNTALGSQAMTTNTTGSGNTAVGQYALGGSSTSSNNVAVGQGAMPGAVTGNNSSAMGWYSMNNLTSGGNNVAIGYETMFSITTGGANTALGTSAGNAFANPMTGSNNTFLGYYSGPTDNAASMASGQITLVGSNARATLGGAVAGAYMTAIGADSVVTTVNTVVLGRTTDNVAIGQTGSGAYKLYVNGTAGGTSAYVNASDARFKTNIVKLGNALAIIDKLQGVRYDFNQAAYPDRNFEKGRQLGFIAQQIEPYLPEVVRTDAEGYKGVQYSSIVPLLAEGIKEQQEILKHFIKQTPSTLLLDIKTFQSNEAIFAKLDAQKIKTDLLEAESAKIKKLEAEQIESKSVRSDVVKSGEMDTFVAIGAFQPMFVPLTNTQYIVNAVADDGSVAFASVSVNGSKIIVTPLSGHGVDLTTIGNQVGVVAANKRVKATWIRMS